VKQQILLSTLLFFVVVGFVAWRVNAGRTLKINHAMLIHDPSLSHPDGCSAVIGLAERAFGTDALSSRSTLTMLAVGDESSAYQPKLVAKYAVPKNRKAIEGRSATITRRQQLLSDLRMKCESLRPTLISPISLGLKQGIAQLRALGCKDNFDCHLYINSDGEENADSSIRRALDGSRGKSQTLPAALDNKGIHVVFCGLAVRAGRIVDPSGREIRRTPPHDPGRDDRLRSTWTSLFAEPQLVSFEPYCPQPSNAEHNVSKSSLGFEHHEFAP